MKHKSFIVPPNKKIRLEDYDPAYTGKYSGHEEINDKLQKDLVELRNMQNTLYAQDTYALLIIFQAMDAAGKDGAIKHVMSGVNPQGCQVFSFKAPSSEELDHDYMWRSMKALPERGRIGIFNRSYYEETLVVRVHPEILASQRMPAQEKSKKKIWRKRFDDINNIERYLSRNGIVILKFFLNVSKEEQKKRFMERIDTPEKNWKFSSGDVNERAHWDEYMQAYEDVFNHTSTTWAPWYIVPADNKWFTRTAVADIIVSKLKSLDLKYPTLSKEKMEELLKAKEMLDGE